MPVERSIRRVAVVTCRALPRPDPGLPVLRDAFGSRGVEATIAAWDDLSIDWSGFDAVVIQSTWNYVQEFERFWPWLEATAKATRLVNPLEVIRWNIHKRYLIELAAAGVPTVATELVPAGVEPAWDSIFARWDEIVLKPAISAGSFQTVRVAKGDVNAARTHRLANGSRDMLVQPLLPSVIEQGERNLVYLGGRFEHAIRKGARWSGQPEASGGLLQPDRDELDLAEQVLATVRAKGIGEPAYARVDVARDRNDRAVLMELELIEPSLFFDRVHAAAGRLAEIVLADLQQATKPRLS